MNSQQIKVDKMNGYWWGVDSFTPANEKWTGKKTLYDYLLETLNFDRAKMEMPAQLRGPSFWGRYLLPSRDPQKKGGSLTMDEITYLHDRDRKCKILPVYNGNLPTRSQKFEEGKVDAESAMRLASCLKIPRDKCIYLNVDSKFDKIRVEYILGWWSTLLDRNVYRAGLYCALNIEEIYTPAFDYMRGLVNPWKPWKPLQDIRLPTQYFPFDRFSYIWCGWKYNPGSTVAGDPPDFNPGVYTCNPRGCRVWQYSTNRALEQVVKIGNGPAQLKRLLIQGGPMPVDLNLATQEGFDAMY